ncbi:Fic family protein [Falsarthrobacter nasiphocae]|uniref:Fic family protein n=1 Tax=Falsarthrobacter nasiphocae TaxID=189863 RepID=A0AAE4C7X8_9MICC|nr:Fic family protein [Falsarthrobacter nasiphocae]MDR6891835.1 Fic family protein [Falsarthrobacter nasiphocae]
MPLVKHAPSRDDCLKVIPPDRLAYLVSLMAAPGGVVDDSRYFHWEELTRRTPPEDLTHEEWWLVLKQQRLHQRREVPLRQKSGEPFWFAMTDEVLRLAEEVARRSGGTVVVKEGTLTPSRRDQYLVRSLVEESISSSQLEGASTSRRVALELLDSGREARDTSERMIVNNYAAMQAMMGMKDGDLEPGQVLDLHCILVKGTLNDPEDAGRLEPESAERVRVWAGDQCVHVPPPASELPSRLEELCAFVNQGAAEVPYIPPVVRAVIGHFMVGYDHYFADGNGRTARAVFYWSMLRHGFWLAEFLAISSTLKSAPAQYGLSYEKTEDDDGDLTYFILHQLRVLVTALDELDEYLARKQAEAAALQQALRDAAGTVNARQTSLLDAFLREPAAGITVKEAQARFRVSPQTARNDLELLEGMGLVERGASKRPVTWWARPDIEARVKAAGQQSPLAGSEEH